MRLQLSSWPDIEQYLQEASGIIVPIGSTEQHGPNGLIAVIRDVVQSLARHGFRHVYFLEERGQGHFLSNFLRVES